ncbi:hypothetical protein VTH82DRAFT_7384 [Thermothelomyces myriococcoides]
MSTCSQIPKSGLDARTAELKEKLLRNRSQVQRQALLVLHRAGASDIAELIASISASVSRPSETARNHIEKQDKSEDIAQAGSTSALSYRRQKPDHEPPIPTPTHITAKSITPTRAAECDSQSAATDPQPAPRGSTNETIERGRARPLASTLGFSEEGNMGSTQNYELSYIRTQPTPIESPNHNMLDGEVKSHTDALMCHPSIEKQSMESKMNGNQPSYSETEASDEVFTRLLNQMPDLRDFLEMTDYYNVEVRTRKLSRFRRAKALAAEKRRIEEEERKLKEEEELEMGLQRSTVAPVTGAIPCALSDSDSNTVRTPVTPIPKSLNENEGRETSRAIPLKRELEPGTSPEPHQEKVPRLEAPPSTRSRDSEDRYQEDVRREDRYSRRESSPRHEDRHRQSPLSWTHYRDDYEGDDYRREDKYNDEDGHWRESVRRSSYPIPVDLGGKGDTRFFILKSFNTDNVKRCMQDNLWTTQVPNAEILAKAFEECKNVILFFSVNKSKAFQGYARMTSPPSPDNPQPSFIQGIHWETGDPFRVEWLSKTTVDFWRIGDIRNPYNEDLPVFVAKDGQEIEEECGATLLKELEQCAMREENRMTNGSRSSGGGRGPPVERHYSGRRESNGTRGYWDRYRR